METIKNLYNERVSGKKEKHLSLKNKPISIVNNGNYQFLFDNYNSEKYLIDVNKYGLEYLWDEILDFILTHGQTSFLNIKNFGEMYEAGLAEIDKNDKKKSGQYYTPKDVSKLMAQWLYDLDGVNVCDIGCGTGNLILSYLELVSEREVIDLLENKRIYLYDFDKIALKIAKYSIAILYGSQYLDSINCIYGDFLNENVEIPKNSKIITNPPYAKIETIDLSWSNSKIQKNSKELYAAFMEKIIASSNPAVIISPFSFLGGAKFYELRKLLSTTSGFIVAFDNVPGNIFNGRKHGVFNTNTANSVRAAITVIENKQNIKGFKTTHLIRFKNEERENLFTKLELEKQLSSNRQIVNNDNKMFARIHTDLESCFKQWISKSTKKMVDLLNYNNEDSFIYMPNTCRYFTTASKTKLQRGGYLSIPINNRDVFNYVYAMINSSFVYWWWRIFDGGITYPVGLFNDIPVFYDLLTDKNKQKLGKLVDEMINEEDKYKTTKMNAGNIQENIKFPPFYRDKINKIFLEILNCEVKSTSFDFIHRNSHFGETLVEDDE